jgi:SagB-type dehydrogenase family enzyme
MTDDSITIALPEPRYDSDISVEETLLQRRSIRDYTDEALTLLELAQLLWATQGITDPRGFRTAPSAGATYPLEVYTVIGDVEGIVNGIYRYKPHQHELIKVVEGEQREALAQAALDQQFIAQAPVDLVITAVYERTTGRYGERGIRYVHMEAGHAAQNVYLQAVALNLGTVVVGAFYDNQVTEILKLADNEVPLYIIPVGRIKD